MSNLILKRPNKVIVAIPDLHAPFTNKDLLSKVYDKVKEVQPDIVVVLGDAFDMYSFSRFSTSPNLTTPAQEMKEARRMLTEFWAKIKQNSKHNVECFQLRGNHEERIWKRLMSNAPAYESLLQEPIKKLAEFPGVTTLERDRDELVINGIVFIHGWSILPTFHMKYFLQPVVHGHTHKASLMFERHNDSTIWEMDCGCLADIDKLPLQYTSTSTSKWIPAIGVIDQHGPRLVLL